MSDCACLYGGWDDYDEFGFQHHEMRTARKSHVCRECKREIRPGERYEHFSSKNDGSLFTVKTCETCAEIRSSLYCDGFVFGNLWADVRSQLFPRFSLACVEKLKTSAAKEVLTKRYQEYLGVQ